MSSSTALFLLSHTSITLRDLPIFTFATLTASTPVLPLKLLLFSSVVSSCIDYYNSLLLGLPNKSCHKIQLVQIAAALIITRTPSTYQITPVLEQLYWLPIKYCSEYKTLLLTFNFFFISLRSTLNCQSFSDPSLPST